jgi:2-keto-4-pentenoate hydratase/2-oxohepta-3-ene-1,7-dioic acid hydratase in catechol pathway
VLTEDIGDPQTLDIRARLNGVEVQSSNTRQMIFPVARLLSFLSRQMTLMPGDLVSTGTPAGVGPLRDGDVVEIEIAGIGVLRNPVRAEPR